MAKIKFAFGEMSPPSKDDNKLYHYCSLNSFYNILKNDSVRLYDIRSMNDPSEMYMRKINAAKLILSEYEAEPFDFCVESNKTEIDFKDYLDILNFSYVLTAGGNNNSLTMAFCMSEDEDSLSQWRLYGDSGRGVCLGLDKSVLERYKRSHNNFSLESVQYKSSMTLHFVEKAREVLKQIKKLYESNKTHLMEYRFQLGDIFYADAYKYKVDAYKLEKEVRLVYNLGGNNIIPNCSPEKIRDSGFVNEIEFDIKNNQVRAYHTIKLSEIGLKSITLGPQNDNAKDILNLLLAKYGKDNIDIYKSYLPFRN